MTAASLSDIEGSASSKLYGFGAVPLADDATRFRLWAPSADKVMLALDGQALAAMARLADGFHELTLHAPAGTRYRFGMPADVWAPDPASRLQDGDVHDSSIVCDVDRYSWQFPEWIGRPWTDTVLYEIHCGLAGGFVGVRQRLPELARLGITAVELMPIADFPGPRNWGYDGVLPYAPDRAYGSPDELRALIDAAHGLGMMVFLDVVYNHFGPDGNYLPSYAPEFFRSDLDTPWGPAIDFRRRPVRRFFAENALYWLREYRFDGLRLDAVHAISDQTWLPEMAAFVRRAVDSRRHVHLVLENDDNAAGLLKQGFNAQWNDDAHHVVHHLLTGESSGYYASYARNPENMLARALAEGFVFQGQTDPARKDRRRGEPSADLSPDRFVFFLQNHDQVGNRALGERLADLAVSLESLRAAVALQLLTPHIPLLFMGEEQGARTPFLYFTSHDNPELARAVRDGRRKEFAGFPAFADEQVRSAIPDPNEPDTWQRSRLPQHDDPTAEQWRQWYERLLALRGDYIVPRLPGARSLGAEVLGPRAVHASWEMGDGARLTIFCNLGSEPCACPALSEVRKESVFFLGPCNDDDGIEAADWQRGVPGNCVVAAMEPAGESNHA
ncbi:malto-oligosyltrehalose trehalohydrolase [Pusillimonas sp.]|uniref:malto-oligosyltrehalose trehalohydrolase n=1 Tax=Pusillimonas sp. TaxID=3040095 RepID=UPI0037CA70BA